MVAECGYDSTSQVFFNVHQFLFMTAEYGWKRLFWSSSHKFLSTTLMVAELGIFILQLVSFFMIAEHSRVQFFWLFNHRFASHFIIFKFVSTW